MIMEDLIYSTIGFTISSCEYSDEGVNLCHPFEKINNYDEPI